MAIRAGLLSADAQNYFDLLLALSCGFVAAKVQSDDLPGRAERAGISDLLRGQDLLQEMVADLIQQFRASERSAGPATAIVDQLSAPRVFADDLRSLHPWRRAEAEEIAGLWPDFVTFVHTLVATNDRSAVLRQWEHSPPAPFESAPAQAWCWLGLMAADQGEGPAAAGLIMRGVSRGAFPANYWIARAAAHVDAADRDRAAALLAEATEPHPLGRAVAAIQQTDFATATAALDLWQPDAANDRAIKATILATCLAAQGQLNRAITVALDAANDVDATGVALVAANLLLSRGRFGPSDHPLADSDHALALALRARNGRRAWGGDSTAAALVAVLAAGMSGDVDRALELTQPPPAGDATPLEARDMRLRREAAVLAAMTGQFDRARDLAADANDAFISSTVDGFEALASGDNDTATAAFMAAFNAAPDDTARLRTVSAMVELGA